MAGSRLNGCGVRGYEEREEREERECAYKGREPSVHSYNKVDGG